MKKEIFTLLFWAGFGLVSGIGQAGILQEVDIISSAGNNMTLTVGPAYHRLAFDPSSDTSAVIDTIYYYRPPASPVDYNDFLANYQGVGDTCINWFTLLAPGTVTKLMMQNESAGTARLYLWAPAIDTVNDQYQFPGDTTLEQLLPDTAIDYYSAQQPDQQFTEEQWTPQWNTYDLENELGSGIYLNQNQLNIWVGYSLDNYGNPRIWQDGYYHAEQSEGSCRSFTTLHSKTPGRWYRNVQPGNPRNWVAHLMQIEVRYEHVPPIVTEVSRFSDTFDLGKIVTARVIEIEGDTFRVYLNYKTSPDDIFTEIPMEKVGSDTFQAAIYYPEGATVSYYVKAIDATEFAGSSPVYSFQALTRPTDKPVLLIDDTPWQGGQLYRQVLNNLERPYYYWAMAEHNGIDKSVIHHADFQTLFVIGGEHRLVPVDTVADDYGIEAFLNSGGNLGYVDMDFLYRWDLIGAGNFTPGDFVYDYLGIEDYESDPDNDVDKEGGSADLKIRGIEADSISNHWSVDTSRYGPLNYQLLDSSVQNWGDYIDAADQGVTFFKGDSSGNGMAVRKRGTHFRTVTFAFPIEFSYDSLDFYMLVDSTLEWLDQNRYRLEQGVAIAAESPLVPDRIRLRQNFPNPFNPQTKIRFDLGAAQKIQLSIYDIRGRLVRNLVRDRLPAGQHQVSWDGRDQDGQLLPSGIYLYRIYSPTQSISRKMILLR